MAGGGRGWQGVAGGGRGMKSDDLEPHEAKVNYIQVLFLTSSNKIKLKSQVPLETVIKEGGVGGGGRGRQGTPGDARGRQGTPGGHQTPLGRFNSIIHQLDFFLAFSISRS